ALDGRAERVELRLEVVRPELARAARAERGERERAESLLLLGVEERPGADVGPDADRRDRVVGDEVGGEAVLEPDPEVRGLGRLEVELLELEVARVGGLL